MKSTRKLAILALFVSMALVLHVVENFLPIPYIAPGVKLGLANIVSLIAIIVFGFKEALIIVLLRTFLGSLLGGVPSSFFFSAAGGLLSTFVMYFTYKWVGTKFSLVGISISGAVAHNVGQLFVASLIVENFGLYVYLPLLMISAVVTGIFIGFAANYTVGFIKASIDID
jgi:heptaprenyl diphosphate synthase